MLNLCDDFLMAQYRLKAMEMWYRYAPGSALLKIEQEQLLSILGHIPGSRLLQVGGPSDMSVIKGSRFLQQYYLGTHVITNHDGPRIEADLTALPILSESLDAIVLIHMLEFESNPAVVLQELYRTLVPGGQLIILAFNPWSLWGLARLRRGKKGFPWQGSFWSMHQIKSNLSAIGYRVLANKTLCFRPPLENLSWFHRLLFLEAVGQIFLPSMGGVFLLSAQKVIPGMTPLGTKWWSEKIPSARNSYVEPTTRNGN